MHVAQILTILLGVFVLVLSSYSEITIDTSKEETDIGVTYTTPTECECGEFGKCRYDEWGEDNCECNKGYLEFEGTCKECNCGAFGKCSFDDLGEKTCTCDLKYIEFEGTCQRCSCDDTYAACTFLADGKKSCRCQSGFKRILKVCKDIDECEVPNICPNSTKCVNTIGSYNCECIDGYELPPSEYNVKQVGCDEINECQTIVCSTNAICVNIPGSYRCDCKEGFKEAMRLSKENIICQGGWAEMIPMFVMAGVSGVQTIVASIVASIAIYRCRKRRKERKTALQETVLKQRATTEIELS